MNPQAGDGQKRTLQYRLITGNQDSAVKPCLLAAALPWWAQAEGVSSSSHLEPGLAGPRPGQVEPSSCQTIGNQHLKDKDHIRLTLYSVSARHIIGVQ